MYAEMYGPGQAAGSVIDNSDQTVDETVQSIIDSIALRPAVQSTVETAIEADDLVFIISDQPAAADRAFISRRIKEFNDSVSAYHRLGRQQGKQPLAATMRNAGGELSGGLLASTYWGWLDIEELWVAENYRRQGYGRRLLRMVEETAVDRGCQSAQVKTWDFQARGFYEGLGYHVVGWQTDFPPGQTLFWLRKELIQQDTE
jgi:ribosomal protein S18 acetylase RimI-like enzyme